jgi:hypothetical protein
MLFRSDLGISFLEEQVNGAFPIHDGRKSILGRQEKENITNAPHVTVSAFLVL